MRFRDILRASALVLLLAGCRSGEREVVLVHASDPHLFDAKRPQQEPLNVQAFQAMMDAVAGGAAGDPAPRYLVLTGDLGIESSHPLYTPLPDGAAPAAAPPAAPQPAEGAEPEEGATPPDDAADPAAEAQPAETRPAETTRAGAAPPPAPAARPTRQPTAAEVAHADSVRQAQVETVAGLIQEGPFEKVFFVPGNNDLFLEDGRPEALEAVAAFVAAVNGRLRGKEVRDLSACFRRPDRPESECFEQIDSSYALVGFPSGSLKNAALSRDDFRKTLPRGIAPFDTAAAIRAEAEARVPEQDRRHLRMLQRLRRVVSSATAGGRRALVLTHVPDLDDPFTTGQVRTRSSTPGEPRLTGPRAPDAWNASEPVFATWQTIVESPRVLGVLAGHFHDAHREVYFRPYAWSSGQARSDRWKTFVAPPLSVKSQDASPIQARGFAVLTLSGDSVRRRIHWYDGAQGFTAEEDARRDAQEDRRADGGIRQMNPFRDLPHLTFFVVALFFAGAAVGMWRTPTYASPSSGAAEAQPTFGGNLLRTISVGLAALIVALLLEQSWTEPVRDVAIYTIFWFIAAFILFNLPRIVGPSRRQIVVARSP